MADWEPVLSGRDALNGKVLPRVGFSKGQNDYSADALATSGRAGRLKQPIPEPPCCFDTPPV